MLMRTRPYPGDRRRRRIIGLSILLVAALVVTGVYLALSSGDRVQVGPPPARADGSSPGLAGEGPRVASALEPIARTGDPKTFATDTAEALFAWDTDSPIPLSDYTGRLLAVADPSGVDSPGLVADLATYLPSTTAWADLKPYLTRQWLQVTSATLPTTWLQAASHAEAYGVAPGTTAYTITGVRHRAGVWDGRTVQTEHDVSFTLFIVCQPSYPTCHLLRISKLDDPLP